MAKIIEKVVKFVKSPETKKVAKAGAKFLKQTGLAQKVVDKINKGVAKKTSKKPHIDKFREQVYQEVSKHTRNGKKGYGEAGIEFLKESRLGEKASTHINKKINEKKSKNPILDSFLSIASSSVAASQPFSRSGVDHLAPRRPNQIFDQPKGIQMRGEKMNFK